MAHMRLCPSPWELCPMPKKDELSQRRHRNLVDHLEDLMRAALKPEYEGYYGQLILGSGDLAELGELGDVRRAAREAGRRLYWKPVTRLVGGRLFVLDTREAPDKIARLAEEHAAEAMAEAFRRKP
ncbi:hypothetical protein [Streptomyces axinellae]|uniref:TfoX N-terminal domain-containing protein n=1 Tax=Streptomyces axinellae TaxID=552788 RepID=A0ABP6CLF9_9ACTN